MEEIKEVENLSIVLHFLQFSKIKEVCRKLLEAIKREESLGGNEAGGNKEGGQVFHVSVC